MSEFANALRPKPDDLNAMATLQTMTPYEGVVWELKLVTNDKKYWLCTKGVERGRDVPEEYTAGRVIAESLIPNPESDADTLEDYGADDVRQLHGWDYLTELFHQIKALEKEQEDDFQNARAKEINDLRRDLEATKRALGFQGPSDLGDLD